MAKRNYKKKRKQINGAFVVVFSIVLAFSILITLNSSFQFTEELPSWAEIKGGIDSALDIPQKEKPPADAKASFHIIDVGQGSASLILSDSGNVLVDAGENDQGEKVVSYLKKQGVEKLDYVVATHPHSDHIGGMDVVIKNIPVDNIVMPHLKDSITPTTKSYEDLLKAITEKQVNVIAAQVGQEYPIGSGMLRILGPVGDFDDLNDMSAAVKFTFGNSRFLLTGDMEKQAEKALIALDENLSADVFVLGHHGSKTSNTTALLERTGAAFFAAQCGYGNDYGHPHAEAVKRVKDSGGTLYRTDYNGNVVFYTDGDQLSVSVQKERKAA